ncbi:hypothetical protein CHH67_12490 [Paenibacillus campinasensis]|uniref:Uncharacterized protein n=1 Tax=Paenibacillus campinasensis TaxID=66347 RepID=A0A268ETH9_9BACL|nr:hypothetical protein CHH67_12490 [Paenibacillus campinasensis]
MAAAYRSANHAANHAADQYADPGLFRSMSEAPRVKRRVRQPASDDPHAGGNKPGRPMPFFGRGSYKRKGDDI